MKDINKAIRVSAIAKSRKARAEILSDGRIQYSTETVTRSGKKYRQKVSFYDILKLLHGEDIRELRRKYS